MIGKTKQKCTGWLVVAAFTLLATAYCPLPAPLHAQDRESTVERIAAMVRKGEPRNETLSVSPAPAVKLPNAEASCMATLNAVSHSSSHSAAMWQSLVESYRKSSEQDRQTILRQRKTIDQLMHVMEEPCRVRVRFMSETRMNLQPLNCNIAVDQNLGKSQQFVLDPFSNLTLDGRDLQ